MDTRSATLNRAPPTPNDSCAAKVLVVGQDTRACDGYGPIFKAEKICVFTVTPTDALSRLRSDPSFDLVLIDAVTAHSRSLELCRRIKQQQNLSLLPVVILLHRDQAIMRSVALRWGADDCLTLPEQDDEIFHRCKNLIRTKQATDVLENSEKVFFSLARIIEGKDKYTQGHVERVSVYSVQLGQRMGLTDADIVALQKGGVVHDVGKVAIPDAVLNKLGPLDGEGEWDAMKRHPLVGYDLLAPLRTFRPVLPIVRWHHERPNGTGYPDGVGGGDLPLTARIVAVADCFDALTTARPYRGALPIQRSLDIIAEGAARGDFDPELVAILRDLSSRNVATESS